MNVIEVDGKVEKLLVVGDISLHIPEISEGLVRSKEVMILKLANTASISEIVPNTQFITVGQNDFSYSLQFSKLSGYQDSSITIFKYRVQVDSVPIYLKPVWEFANHQTSLKIAYSIDERFAANMNDQLVSFSVVITGGGELGLTEASADAVWEPEERGLLWDIEINSKSKCGELSAILSTTELGTPCPVMIHFRVPHLISDIHLESNINILSIQRYLDAGHFGSR